MSPMRDPRTEIRSSPLGLRTNRQPRGGCALGNGARLVFPVIAKSKMSFKLFKIHSRLSTIDSVIQASCNAFEVLRVASPRTHTLRTHRGE